MEEPNLIKKDGITDSAINKQRKILLFSVLCVVTLLLGTSYSLLTNFDKTDDVVNFKTGNLNMTVNNTVINLENKLPESDESGLKNSTPAVLTLTNTGSLPIMKFDVKLVANSKKESTLDNKYIKYAISTDNGVTYSVPELLTSNSSIIFSGYNLISDASKTIYLKVWISKEAGNEALNKTYYGSVQVDLYQKGEVPYATNVIRETVNGTGGVVAIKNDGSQSTDKEDIREYRYSGVNANNYVRFNSELWRIIGVFSEIENNQVKEYVKIVRDETISNVPGTYTVNDTNKTYELRDSNGDVYYNKYDIEGNNDWTTSGLMYFLNTERDNKTSPGYIIRLKTKQYTDEVTYYLGNVELASAKELYTSERGNIVCGNDISSNSNKNQCNIWTNNKATWNGRVGLMTASDIAYSNDTKDWNTDMSVKVDSSWVFDMTKEDAKGMLLLNPAVNNQNSVLSYNQGKLEYTDVTSALSVRPVVALSSKVIIERGAGTKENPYVLGI